MKAKVAYGTLWKSCDDRGLAHRQEGWQERLDRKQRTGGEAANGRLSSFFFEIGR